jgi:hypothetical protein
MSSLHTEKKRKIKLILERRDEWLARREGLVATKMETEEEMSVIFQPAVDQNPVRIRSPESILHVSQKLSARSGAHSQAMRMSSDTKGTIARPKTVSSSSRSRI